MSIFERFPLSLMTLFRRSTTHPSNSNTCRDDIKLQNKADRPPLGRWYRRLSKTANRNILNNSQGTTKLVRKCRSWEPRVILQNLNQTHRSVNNQGQVQAKARSYETNIKNNKEWWSRGRVPDCQSRTVVQSHLPRL